MRRVFWTDDLDSFQIEQRYWFDRVYHLNIFSRKAFLHICKHYVKTNSSSECDKLRTKILVTKNFYKCMKVDNKFYNIMIHLKFSTTFDIWVSRFLSFEFSFVHTLKMMKIVLGWAVLKKIFKKTVSPLLYYFFGTLPTIPE